MADSIELFLPIPGYEGRYSVSNFGTVISHNYNKTGSVVVMKGLTSKLGYKQVKLSTKGKRQYPLVHRLVMLVFVGPCPEGMEVNHKSGVKSDNRLCNLEYCSRSENSLHAYRTGLAVAVHGERHCRARLSVKAILDIKELHQGGMPQASIARRYRIDASVISRVLNGKRWIRALRENSHA